MNSLPNVTEFFSQHKVDIFRGCGQYGADISFACNLAISSLRWLQTIANDDDIPPECSAFARSTVPVIAEVFSKRPSKM
jgi:hypothetical protein